MVAGSAPLPAGSSRLLAFLWSSCRSVCHWVNLTNTALIRLASRATHQSNFPCWFRAFQVLLFQSGEMAS